MSFVNLKIFPSAVNAFGLHWLFWIHSVSCILLIVLAGLLLPETQGKTLTELSEMFEKKSKSTNMSKRHQITKEQEASMA